ncbi:MAG TPA: hypothetical protein VED41_04905 [Solirubrobacteraceae bacterium]|nr:hypothetical protein [Solirubrobacteraceae bacterium]
MTPRTPLLIAFAAVLGALIAVLPALGAPSEAKIEVNENCGGVHNWQCFTLPGATPKPASVTIAAGGVITFADKTGFAANITWKGSAPVCSPSVPVSPTPAATGWEGTCKFEAPGTYVLEDASMYYPTASVTVEATNTATTTTGTTTTTAGGSSGSGGASTSAPGSGSQAYGGAGGPGPGSAPAGSLFVGAGASACKLASTQRGPAVHGSVDVSQAGAGGRLEVELLATRASLASDAHPASTHALVGRFVRSSVQAGSDAFAVALDAKARRALRARGHLSLTVRILLSAAQGETATITRSVVVRG